MFFNLNKKIFNVRLIAVIGFYVIMLAPSHAFNALTPPNEPFSHQFYVCYHQRHASYVINYWLSPYIQYQYDGCMISKKPCCQLKNKKCLLTLKTTSPVKRCCTRGRYRSATPSKHCRLKSFGFYNTYLQAINGFYRCAYNA